MSNIYNISQEYLQIAEQLEQGEFTPELEQALAINKESLEIKAIKYGYVQKGMLDDISTIDKEIERLEALKRSKENAIAKIKETVKSAMVLYGIKEIKMQNLKVSLSPSKAVVIEDENDVPAKYKSQKVTTTTTISKKLIKEDLEKGIEVGGARLQENQNLQIK